MKSYGDYRASSEEQKDVNPGTGKGSSNDKGDSSRKDEDTSGKEKGDESDEVEGRR